MDVCSLARLSARWLTATLVAASLSSPVFAQSDRLRQNCSYAQGERQIRACNDFLALDGQSANDRAGAYSTRAALHNNSGRQDLALADSIAAYKEMPGSPYYRRRLSDAYSSRGEFVEAFRIDPKNTSAMLSQATADANQGDFDKAIEWYTTAISQGLDGRWTVYDQAAALFARGKLFFAIGDVPRAVADYRASLKLAAGNNADALAYLCVALLKVGDAAEAEEPCNKVASGEGLTVSQSFRPIMFLWMERLLDAQKVAERECIGNKLAYGCYTLGMALEAQGDATGAEQQFARAREMSNTNTFARIDGQLKRYRKPKQP